MAESSPRTSGASDIQATQDSDSGSESSDIELQTPVSGTTPDVHTFLSRLRASIIEEYWA